MVPQSLINEADSKAAEFQLAKMAAASGFTPIGWNDLHPCEFGVFQKGKSGFCVAPLFAHAVADLGRDGFRCIYRTDH